MIFSGMDFGQVIVPHMESFLEESLKEADSK